MVSHHSEEEVSRLSLEQAGTMNRNENHTSRLFVRAQNVLNPD